MGVGAHSGVVVAAEAAGDQEGAPGVAGDPRASLGEVGSLVCIAVVEGPAQLAVAPRGACAPG